MPIPRMRDDDRESLSDHEQRLKRIEEMIAGVVLTQVEHTEALCALDAKVDVILERVKVSPDRHQGES